LVQSIRSSNSTASNSTAPRLILASASRSRRELLESAGVMVTSKPAQIDEDEIKLAMRAEGAAAIEVAETLAELKALRVSQQDREALVVGADQILTCGDLWFDKPADLDHAAGHLRALSGKSHELLTCVCVARGGSRIWHHRARATLVMRPLSEAYIRDYLSALGPRALESVGAYQLEGLGAQLFSRVEGDFFTILGLPLLPLLEFLRSHEVIGR
jgi:septum formation protein